MEVEDDGGRSPFKSIFFTHVFCPNERKKKKKEKYERKRQEREI